MNESINKLLVAGEGYHTEFKRSFEKSFIEEFGTKSVARNPVIASLLHRIDYIEKVGTGIGRIKQEVEQHGELSRAELQKKLSIKNNEHFRNAYITPALECNVIAMTRPNKPNSRFQKYRLTDIGQQLVEKEAIDSKKNAFIDDVPENSSATSEKTVGEMSGERQFIIFSSRISG